MDEMILITQLSTVLLLVFLFVIWKGGSWINIFIKMYLFIMIILNTFALMFNPLIKEIWI